MTPSARTRRSSESLIETRSRVSHGAGISVAASRIERGLVPDIASILRPAITERPVLEPSTTAPIADELRVPELVFRERADLAVELLGQTALAGVPDRGDHPLDRRFVFPA